MNFLTILANISEQLRLSPISTSDNIVQWFTQAVKSGCIKSKFLEKFTIIPAKANVAKYLLPADHIATIGAMFDGSHISKINASEVEFVAPTTPLYYYEDEWEDEASDAVASEFATHYALNEFWPLQLMRSQPSAGAKTVTLLAAPTADGVCASSPIAGVLFGSIYTSPYFVPGYFGSGYFVNGSDDLIWMNTSGIVTSIVSSEGNLLLFYKYIDTLPVDSETDITYNDLMALVYSTGTLSLALSTEDDEYDRYRSWLYGNIADSITGMMAGIAVNARIR